MRRSLVLLVGIAVSGCQCGKEKLTWAGPHAEVTPAGVLEFGKVRFGSKVNRQLVLRARGDASIKIPRIAITPQSAPGYSLAGVPTLPYELPVGQDLKLTVSWQPALGGAAPGQIEVLSDSAAR